MSDLTNTETNINDAASIVAGIASLGFPALSGLINAAVQGLPIAETAVNSAITEFDNLKGSVSVTPAQVASDDAALQAADGDMMAAQPSSSGTTAATQSTPSPLA